MGESLSELSLERDIELSQPDSAPSTVTIYFYLFLSSNKAINYTFRPCIDG